MPGALRDLQALGLDPAGRTITGITYRQGTRCAVAAFRAGPGRGVRRTDLHATLHTAVRDAGVEVRHAVVTDIEQSTDHVDAAGVRARYLVAADGLHSSIRTRVGLSAPSRGRSRWGQRRHFVVEPWTDTVEVTWATHSSGQRSECYVTPIAADVVGVAVLSSTRAGFAEQLDAFPQLAARLRGAATVSDVRGAGPLRQNARGRVAGRVLLAGDAAGYVDALTGEGLALSFATARELVICLLADRPEDYEKAWTRVSRRSRWLTLGLLGARQTPVLSRAVVPVAAAVPRLFGAAVDQLAR